MPLYTQVPENLKLYKQLSILENDPLAKRTIVECGNACRIRVPVKEPNSLLKWDFQTSNYDINFGFGFKEDKNSDSSEIIKIHRVESHRVPETGVFSCPSTGLYELVFDNTYSWMTNKEVIYKVEVVPPKDISYD